MEARDYLSAIVRRWPIVAVFLLLGLAGGYLGSRPASAPPVSSSAPPSYQATDLLELPSSALDPSGLSLDSMAFVATTGPVAAMTVSALHSRLPASSLQSSVQVTPKDTLDLLQIVATQATPAAAVALANTFGQQLMAYIDDRLLASYQGQLAADLKQLDTLAKVESSLRGQPSNAIVQAELSNVQANFVSDSVAYRELQATGPQHTALTVLQPATLGAVGVVLASSAAPSSHSLIPTSRKKLMLFAGLAGLLAGLGVALVRDRSDKKIRTRDQAERALGVPVLGEVSSRRGGRRGPVLLDSPLSADAEAYRMLQTALVAARGPGALQRSRAILLSSPFEVDGKALVLANLSASFSEAGSSVIVLAMDSFDQSLPALMSGARQGAHSAGWAPDQSDDAELLPTVIDGVSLVLDGVRPAIGSGRAQRHLEAVGHARRLADVVLVDTPPVLLTHDAGHLSSAVDSVVLMCPLGEVDAGEATRAVEVLRRLGARVDGVILVAGESSSRRLLRLLARGGSPRPASSEPAAPRPAGAGRGATVVSPATVSAVNTPEV